MFKRPRLRLPHRIVNASLAASVIFLSSCGGDKPKTDENPPKINASEPNVQLNDEVQLQAVWATNPLVAPITSLAFVGGSEPILAASMSTGALQLFDMQGDRITEPVDLAVKKLATGQAVVLDGVALTLFPGISQNGDISFFAYASALGDPVKLPFLPDLDARALCAGAPLDGTSIMQLAYSTKSRPSEIVHGHVQQDADGNLSWSVLSTDDQSDGPITACVADAELETLTDNDGGDLAILNKYGQRHIFLRASNGALFVENTFGKSHPVTINDGITVRTPASPSAMAILSNVQFGNYPNGLMVLGGDVDGASKITLIEPGNLFNRSK